jgi:3-oxoacyl-[acyl-carrier-protein] synthase II
MGIAPSEASTVLVLESARHALRRNAKVLGRLRSVASHFGAPTGEHGGSAEAIASAITTATGKADIELEELSHVCAQGLAHPELDRVEAQAIAQAAPGVPVTAMSSYFGTAGAACGLLELSASLLVAQSGRVLPVHGIDKAAADCPIDALTRSCEPRSSSFIKTSYTPAGLAAAAVIECSPAASE